MANYPQIIPVTSSYLEHCLSGHVEKGNLHFILNIMFHCMFIEKKMHFSKNLRS